MRIVSVAGEFFEVGIVFFDLELGAEESVAAAGVDEIAGGESVAGGGFEGDAIGEEGDFGNGGFLVDIGADVACTIEEGEIELGAFDLVGAGMFDTEARFEVKLHDAVAAGSGDFAAEFLEGLGVEFVANAESI